MPRLLVKFSFEVVLSRLELKGDKNLIVANAIGCISGTPEMFMPVFLSSYGASTTESRVVKR